MYVGVMLGTPGALILVYLTQLPLFAAGLWLGVGAAVAAGITGSLVLLAVSDLLGAALFAALNAVPVALLVRQALLARRRADGSVCLVSAGPVDGVADRLRAGRDRRGDAAAGRSGGDARVAARRARPWFSTACTAVEVPNRDEVASTLPRSFRGSSRRHGWLRRS